MDIVGENSTLCRDIERRDMAMIGSAMCNNFLGAGEEREGRFAKGRALPYRNSSSSSALSCASLSASSALTVGKQADLTKSQ